jgi:tRNA pseudouridine38-40 synthase
MMRDAARRFVGTHSFRAFAKAGQPERGEICIVRSAEWRQWRQVGLEFRIIANRFLHHMVRYMVGTMIDVARARRPVADIDALLRSAPDLNTSPPAPPEGLYLAHVFYNQTELEAEEPFDEILP